MHFTSFLDGKKLTIALTGEIDHHCAKVYIQSIAAKIEGKLVLSGIAPQPLRVFQASGIDKIVEIKEALV